MVILATGQRADAEVDHQAATFHLLSVVLQRRIGEFFESLILISCGHHIGTKED